MFGKKKKMSDINIISNCGQSYDCRTKNKIKYRLVWNQHPKKKT